MANIATVTLIKNTAALLPAGNAAFASTQVALTDAAGAVQTASLTGAETPPWTVVFNNVATGAGTVVATDVDSAGATIGTPVSQSFTEVGSPATFPATTGITVTVS